MRVISVTACCVLSARQTHSRTLLETGTKVRRALLVLNTTSMPQQLVDNEQAQAMWLAPAILAMLSNLMRGRHASPAISFST
jgi:hypothetical protein